MATLTDAKRIVIKIGSALLVDRNTGALRSDWLLGLAQDVSWLKGLGCDVVLVSSGSIALGRGVLGLPRTTLALEQSQAAAAVGQIRLARAYEEALDAAWDHHRAGSGHARGQRGSPSLSELARNDAGDS